MPGTESISAAAAAKRNYGSTIQGDHPVITVSANNWSGLISAISNNETRPQLTTLFEGTSIETRTKYYKLITRLRKTEDNNLIVDVRYERVRDGYRLKNVWFDITHSERFRRFFGQVSSEEKTAAIRERVKNEVLPISSKVSGNFRIAKPVITNAVSEMTRVTMDDSSGIIEKSFGGVTYAHRANQDRFGCGLFDILKNFSPKEFLAKFLASIQEKIMAKNLPDGTTFSMAMFTLVPGPVPKPVLTIATLGDSPVALVIKIPGTDNPLVYQLNEPHKPNLPRMETQIREQGGTVCYAHGCSRVNGCLAVGSALGDNALPLVRKPDIITLTPGTPLFHQIDNDLRRREVPHNLLYLIEHGHVVVAAASDGIEERKPVHYDGVVTFQNGWQLVAPEKHVLYDKRKVTTPYFKRIMPVLFEGKKPQEGLICYNKIDDDVTLTWLNLAAVTIDKTGAIVVLDGHAGNQVVDFVHNELENELAALEAKVQQERAAALAAMFGPVA